SEKIPECVSVMWVAFLASAIACLGLSSPSLAGAILQPEGQGQIIVSGRFEQSDQFFDAQGRLRPVRDYRKFEIQAWMEYGYSKKLTLILAPATTRLQTSQPPTPVSPEMRIRDTYGHLEAGGRYHLADFAGGVLSVQATGRVAQELTGATRGLRQDRNEADARLLYGRSFQVWRWAGYFDLQTGYRLRAGAANEWRTDMTLGFHLRPGWTMIWQVFNLVAWRTTREPAKRSHKLQTSLVYKINDAWSIQAGTFATIAAQNARWDKGFVAAVWRRF
ncbi:MAG: hypothetical protein AB7J19_08270, partial [Beijerinckiaceae bacterium]